MYKERFLNFLTFEKRFSAHTLSAYAKEVDGLLNFISRENVTFEEIDYKLLRYYFSTLKEGEKEAVSVNRSISAVKSYYKFLQREGIVLQNPARLIKALKTPKKLPVVVENDKIVTLLDKMEYATESFEGQRDYIVMELLFGTGIRLSELLKIKERDVDVFNKKVLIFGKRNKERFVPLHSTLLAELKSYLVKKEDQDFENKTEYLVVTKEGKPAYAKLIYRIVKNYLSMITSQKKRSPHILRHSFATTLLDRGADLNAIKELLGHAGLAATQVYTHNSAERLKSIYKQAHPKA
ncbi:tyrosine-type recombinase/integrase [Sphingobacterium pedocola]|uniref:Integrase n=1 Tax=Sphingobacterium pedocola TaxID=2082722 RepID=A0ABR9T5B3_9SPHI|nr:tyrosine-type recombinase/integrase [Sphingobacterium pedocola]MBE8720533.1 integrase [Sphingobacterium pedocola]